VRLDVVVVIVAVALDLLEAAAWVVRRTPPLDRLLVHVLSYTALRARSAAISSRP
jgi:hypothetical protein